MVTVASGLSFSATVNIAVFAYVLHFKPIASRFVSAVTHSRINTSKNIMRQTEWAKTCVHRIRRKYKMKAVCN